MYMHMPLKLHLVFVIVRVLVSIYQNVISKCIILVTLK